MRTALSTLTIAAVLGWSAAAQQGREPAQENPSQSTQRQRGMSGQNMSEMCRQMMAGRQQMMAEMKDLDARLDQKVAQMNSATGDAKVQRMAEVINELVAQRKLMRGKMEDMQQRIMSHMGQHVQSGGAQSAAQCPMMQQPSAKP